MGNEGGARTHCFGFSFPYFGLSYFNSIGRHRINFLPNFVKFLFKIHNFYGYHTFMDDHAWQSVLVNQTAHKKVRALAISLKRRPH
jgi:hypothetical protein